MTATNYQISGYSDFINIMFTSSLLGSVLEGMLIRYLFIILAGVLIMVTLCQDMNVFADLTVEPIYICASQTGMPTLDQGEGGGNPFASALVELLARDKLTFGMFCIELVRLTKIKSKGYQCPEIFTHVDLEKWHFLPKPSSEKRVAMVLVFSDYSISGTENNLPGAKHDMNRVANALDRAGFEVEKVIDPDREKLEIAMKGFADRSAASNVAIIYTTGHGVEIAGNIYLLPGYYPMTKGSLALNQQAVRITELGSYLRASNANLVFYGGCRNNPFRTQ